jgi:hypothetical protein
MRDVGGYWFSGLKFIDNGRSTAFSFKAPIRLMKQNPTPAQENSLKKLFGGNHFERQRVISLQHPDLQPILQELVKANTNTDKLFQIMFSDLLRAKAEMLKYPDDQFWRRTTIRAFSATVDGIIFCLKQTTLMNGKLVQHPFSDYELFFLTERDAPKKDGKKMKLPSFRENLKDTFKLCAKIYKIPCPVDFNHKGFDAFIQTYELRHRLIHPKNYMTFCVSDDERDKCMTGAAWLDTEFKKLFAACEGSL